MSDSFAWRSNMDTLH